MPLQATQIADLVQSIVNDKGPLKMTDNSSDYQQTVAVKRFFKKKKYDVGNGTEFEFNLLTDTNDSARATGLYDTVNVNPNNVLTSGKMPWRHYTYNWGLDHREISMNRGGGGRRIVDIVQSRRIAAKGGWIKLMEQRAWRCPAAADTSHFMGIPYWITKSSTARTTNNGFNGTVSSDHTVVGNISPTTYPRWANMALPYSALTKEDFVDNVWYAMTWTDFAPLVDETPEYDTGRDFTLATNYTVISAMKTLLEAQNEDLGSDLDWAEGKLMFRSTPCLWVRELEDDTTNPMYGINWGVFGLKALRDEWDRNVTIGQHDSQPTVTATHTFFSFNTVCYDRRKCFVISDGTTLLS